MSGDKMGRIELLVPDLGKEKRSLEFVTEEIQKMIREKVPEEFRDSVFVKTFEREDRSGIAIEFDDRAESFIHVALETSETGEE